MRIRFSYVILLSLIALIGYDQTLARDGSSSRESSQGRGYGPASQTSARNRSTGAAQSARTPTRRLREGTIITDQTGYFRENGDGASFVADTGLEFGALQNLNLERVVRLLKNADEPASIRWSVSGEVTEFAGRNYMLISRAVYKSATPPPIPDRVTP